MEVNCTLIMFDSDHDDNKRLLSRSKKSLLDLHEFCDRIFTPFFHIQSSISFTYPPLHQQANRWRKRGLSLVPTKFGISFTNVHKERLLA